MRIYEYKFALTSVQGIKYFPSKTNHKTYPLIPPTSPEATNVRRCLIGTNLKITAAKTIAPKSAVKAEIVQSGKSRYSESMISSL